MIKISVVITTYNRAELLARSLYTYAYQNIRPDQLQIIVIDDWSTDNTQHVCEKYTRLLPNLLYVKPEWKEPGTVRDGAAILNHGIRLAKGHVTCLTHPEVMMMPNTLQAMYEKRAPRRHVLAKPYYLTPEQQLAIDTVPWGDKDKLGMAVREMPGFYDASEPQPNVIDCSHRHQEEMDDYGSQMCSSMLTREWHRVGGMTEYNEWGSVDVDWYNRRQILGIEDVNLMGMDEMVVHQFHDWQGSADNQDKDSKKCLAAIGDNRYDATNPQSAIHLLYD